MSRYKTSRPSMADEPDPLLEKLRAGDPMRLAAATGTSVVTIQRWQERDSLANLAPWVRRALADALNRPAERAHHGRRPR